MSSADPESQAPAVTPVNAPPVMPAGCFRPASEPQLPRPSGGGSSLSCVSGSPKEG